ncbi:MAG: PLDc_N domain-containing protein [Sedimentisphaerales bacterium]|nr:PLDc_N domain-containing protein [Sedimentisphaerales bacterium]
MGFLIALIFMGIGFGGLVLWIWALIDCINNETDEGNERVIWVVVIAAAQLIGALIYLIARRPKRMATLGH